MNTKVEHVNGGEPKVQGAIGGGKKPTGTEGKNYGEKPAIARWGVKKPEGCK